MSRLRAAPNSTAPVDAATVLENVADGFFALNRDWVFVFVNRAAEQILGRSRADLAGKRIWDMYPEALDTAFEEKYREAFETQKLVSFEEYYAPLDLWVRVRAHPTPDLLCVFFADISAEKRAEQCSREAAERLRLTVEAARAVTWTWDIRTDVVVWDGDVAGMFGQRADQLSTAAAIMDVMHGDDRPRVERAIAEAAATGSDYAAEFRVCRPDGSTRWILANGKMYRDAQGQLSRMAGINIDITERKQTEDALRRALTEAEEARGLLEAVFAAHAEGLLVCNCDGVASRTNPAATRYFGFDPAGMHVSQIVERLGVPGGAEASVTMRALHGETIIAAEQVARDRVIETSSAPVRDAEGRVVAAVTISRDITRRKRAEEALRDSEARFRALADCIPQLAWMADSNGYIFWYNQRWYDYTGTTFEQVRGWGWKIVHHPGHVKRVVERIQHSWTTGEPWEDTFPLRGRDRQWRWFLSRALPIRDEAGAITLWFGTNTDITGQLEQQTALRESEERFRQMSEAVPGVVWTTDPGGAVDYLNSQWYRYTGQTEERALSSGWLDAIHPGDLERCRKQWSEAFGTGVEFETELRLRRHDGCYRWFLRRGRPLRHSSGVIVKWVGTCTEIHDQKATEEALRRSNEDLQQFAYVASHDLQEPLRSVVSFSQLLAQRHRDSLNGDGEQYLDYVVDAGVRMSTLINDLLTYSRTISDRNRVVRNVDLEQTLSRTLADMRLRIEESRATVTHDPLPVVAGDPTQLGQVLQNLLSNAIKYRQAERHPRIHITARRDGADWLISVADNGQGFAPEYAHRIFGIFKRLHGKDVPGNGIGLAICKTVVERHGGRIWAEPAPGQGTTFSFTLPAPDS